MNDAQRRLVQADTPQTFASAEAARAWQSEQDAKLKAALRLIMQKPKGK